MVKLKGVISVKLAERLTPGEKGTLEISKQRLKAQAWSHDHTIDFNNASIIIDKGRV